MGCDNLGRHRLAQAGTQRHTEGETMTGQRDHIRAEGGRGPCVACGAARGARGDCVARWVRERVGGPREAVRGYAGRLEVSEGAGRPDGLQ